MGESEVSCPSYDVLDFRRSDRGEDGEKEFPGRQSVAAILTVREVVENLRALLVNLRKNNFNSQLRPLRNVPVRDVLLKEALLLSRKNLLEKLEPAVLERH